MLDTNLIQFLVKMLQTKLLELKYLRDESIRRYCRNAIYTDKYNFPERADDEHETDVVQDERCADIEKIVMIYLKNDSVWVKYFGKDRKISKYLECCDLLQESLDVKY